MTAKHFTLLGRIGVEDAAEKVFRHEERFGDEVSRQTYAGSAHPDSETIYLRMPKTPTFQSIFQSLEVEDFPLMTEFSGTVKAVLEMVGGKLARAMIVKLRAGGRIYPHIDQGAYAEATERYHLPLITNDDTWLKCGGNIRGLKTGELWWFDKHVLHEGINRGFDDRVHLIVDFFKTVQ